ncbi:DUF2007 domain-containing protein [Ichthyenterobacterium sp. W332]|uniref:DUF2007 domain-containing protein n=1 Tax=Microcosmobacter mediterraneus TaxID=3075607 RepID=A0ABU2YJ95_9FLAO|nr:DUF2007 domain-containing protein [Ichthyenterobacterium sp. W332]MDT0557882.1 DUF2007 domain-containing protein [Ichthyenterobacterium sp. W332]
MTQKFTTIAKYQYTSEALIVKGRLEADGIQVFLSDSLTIDTDPLVSNAIGGVKLKVFSEDVKKANEILKSIAKYSTDNEGNSIECPNCNSSKVQLISTVTSFKSFFAFLIGFISGTLPFNARYKYNCDHCNTNFDFK